MKRKIITIDDEKCTGCGECIPDCPEGALQMIDGKARLISDLFCDGLGACIGSCPEGAITVEVREAQPYDESKVMENIVRHGANTIKAHLEHLRDHGEDELLREAIAFLVENDIEIPLESLGSKCACGEPGDEPSGREAVERLVEEESRCTEPVVEMGDAPASHGPVPSRLSHWPVQIMLVPPHAPFLDGADLLFAADCVPVAFPGFHEKLLKGRVCMVGCPKFDDARHYLEKITSIFETRDINSITIAYMEVPCCGGLVRIVEEALRASGKKIPLARRKIGIGGGEL